MRRAGRADARAIRALTLQAYAKWVPVIGREPRPMVADYDRAVGDHWIDLLENKGELLGLVEMIPSDGYLLIENIAVAELAQGCGVGGRLLEHAQSVASAAGFSQIRLYTNAAFVSNVTWYARHGYREEARSPLADGGVMVHFVKTVS